MCLLAITADSLVYATQENAGSADVEVFSTAESVSVSPAAADQEIARRLMRILEATGWYDQPDVNVDSGVVFLTGHVDSETHSEWAAELAASTQDVVAVVNEIQVTSSSLWDFSSILSDFKLTLARAAQSAPLVIAGLVLVAVTWIIGISVTRLARGALERRVRSQLLRQVVARAIAIPIYIGGLFLVLHVLGLTNLAFTILGGTGVVGLIIGFGFRDIAENFLSSILISAQRPFAIDDLISVAGHRGFVQSVNTRSTLLMTLEGNHVQIPNSAVYKGTIINYTANPKSRANFTVGIGYDDSIKLAQATALRVLKDHPAVVDDPESLVLVDSLGASTVNLSVLFWIDVTRYSQIRVLSAVIRLTKRAFEENGISMPDEAREVVFPDGLPVEVSAENVATLRSEPRAAQHPVTASSNTMDDDNSANESEGDLASESTEILSQAAAARVPEVSQTNLIDDADDQDR